MSDDADMFAWVIEGAHVSTPIYWDGHDWSGDHMKAVRFARQIDAQTIMSCIEPAMRRSDMRTAEHGWHVPRERASR